MRVIPDFQDELQKIDPRITIVQNPNRPHIANIKLDGIDICPIPALDIREESDSTYTIEFPNGSFGKHRSKREAIDMVRHTLKTIETPDGADAFYGRNGY